MRFVVALLLVAGCGRIGFDGIGEPEIDAPPAHDEDGDGLADAIDPCPHIVGDDADVDGDGVGDGCDPAPAVGGNRIRVFSTLRAGDHPFETIVGLTQEADGLRYTGPNFSTFITMPLVNGVLDVGFEIQGVFGTGQHQIASGFPAGTEPYYFVELNENLGMSNLQVVGYDAVNGYVGLGTTPHGGMHAGIGLLRTEVRTTPPTIAVVGGWTGELYSTAAATPGFVGADRMNLVINGLDVTLRYVVIIDG